MQQRGPDFFWKFYPATPPRGWLQPFLPSPPPHTHPPSPSARARDQVIYAWVCVSAGVCACVCVCAVGRAVSQSVCLYLPSGPLVDPIYSIHTYKYSIQVHARAGRASPVGPRFLVPKVSLWGGRVRPSGRWHLDIDVCYCARGRRGSGGRQVTPSSTSPPARSPAIVPAGGDGEVPVQLFAASAACILGQKKKWCEIERKRDSDRWGSFSLHQVSILYLHVLSLRSCPSCSRHVHSRNHLWSFWAGEKFLANSCTLTASFLCVYTGITAISRGWPGETERGWILISRDEKGTEGSIRVVFGTQSKTGSRPVYKTAAGLPGSVCCVHFASCLLLLTRRSHVGCYASVNINECFSLCLVNWSFVLAKSFQYSLTVNNLNDDVGKSYKLSRLSRSQSKLVEHYVGGRKINTRDW